MPRLKKLLKRLFTPVTIMLIPHTSRSTVSLKMPSIGLLTSAILCVLGGYYVYSVTIEANKYEDTKQELDYYTSQFLDMKSTMSALRTAEVEFRELFSLESREAVLENLNLSDKGSLNMTILREQILKTMDNVREVKDYLSQQRDLYFSTPLGWPISGWIASRFGRRIHPIKKRWEHHTGVDLSADAGDPVRATADGVVTFSKRSGANGNLVAIEHGYGFSTYYAHNKKNLVKVGQVVKRGDIIAYVGSTGSATGPHVHYEMWQNGKLVDPTPYLKGGKW
jgi:murein DD-endopeptidase MepM/ murein hydrolase activator NlpD